MMIKIQVPHFSLWKRIKLRVRWWLLKIRFYYVTGYWIRRKDFNNADVTMYDLDRWHSDWKLINKPEWKITDIIGNPTNQHQPKGEANDN